MLDIMLQTRLLLLLNIILNNVGTMVSNLSHFLNGSNLVKFRNIKKQFWISTDDAVMHPPVILKLLMSSHRGVNITCLCQFLLGLKFSHFSPFVPGSTCFLHIVLVTNENKNMSFSTEMYTMPKGKQDKSRKQRVIK